ncbi:MlaD family protein [Pseudomonas sp. NPDC098747]|uniref:PqiB family protein n=1 Tax=Pseudomonas sp. NPDC098747 TaxID=3364487 RepID=UPI00383A6005
MNDMPAAKISHASKWSAIWVLPLIAAFIGGWLAWKAYDETGVDIQIVFATADGIEEGKTEVVFKGMSVGKVKALALGSSGMNGGVTATVEMRKEVEPHLRSQTRFWLVKPSVSMAGISGLETLVSGNYIAASPGEGEPERKFIALSDPPPLADTIPGLHLTLMAERLGSLSRESPVFYKQIQVGRVKNYALASNTGLVEVQLVIEPQYAALVQEHTRFWNASGVTVNADLTGVKIRSESLASLVSGGIAFATPEHHKDSPPSHPGKVFSLYEDFDAAQIGIAVQLTVTDFEGLKAGHTPVMYKGIQVGTLKALGGNENLSSATAELALDPRTEEYLVEGTEFWIVRPSISLAGITGLEALVKGNYIAVRPGPKGSAAARKFNALTKPPPLDLNSPGLHLVLSSKTLGSLEIGSPVLYKQIKVGTIQSHQLSRDRTQVVLGVHIEAEYANLINSSTRFWNVSGLSVTGGLSGITLKSESLQSLLAGGVTFETLDSKAAPIKKRVPRFDLYVSRESALEQGSVVSIKVNSGEGVRVGTPIRFRGIDIGKVDSVKLDDDFQSVWLEARVTQGADRVLRAGSSFWIVKPQLSLTRTENLETLVTGQYIQVELAEKPGAAQTQFSALNEPPKKKYAEPGLRLVLSAARRGSIKPGVPVTYREMAVGKVTNVELGKTADRVLVHIIIEPRYAPLVRTGSRFWNASGFGMDWALFKGATVRTESIETLLEGGIAFATPDEQQMGNPASQAQTFVLFDEANDEWLQWSPKIALGQ